MTEPYIDNWSRVRPFLHHLLAKIELLSCTLLPPTVRQSSFASGKEGKSTDLLDRSRESAGARRPCQLFRFNWAAN